MKPQMEREKARMTPVLLTWVLFVVVPLTQIKEERWWFLCQLLKQDFSISKENYQ